MHKSVLLEESIDGLNIKPDGKYVDCTLGYAGHSSEILKKLGTKGFLFAFDQDMEAVNYSTKKLESISNNFKIFDTNFKNIKNCIDTKVDGILFDLGVSSPQLDDASRGFSFHNDAKLDMRMDKRQKLSAYEVVDAFDLLNSGGRLVVITFHSLEDRIIKNIFRRLTSDDELSKKLPVVPDEMKAKAKLITKKPLIASNKELEENNRSRSAKLRIIEKI